MPIPLPSGTRPIVSRAPAEAPPPPAPGILETIGASFTASRADTTGYDREVQLDAYKPIINVLEEQGHDFTRYVNPRSGTVTTEGIWQAVEQNRALFPDLPETAEEFEKQWRAKEAARIGRASETAGRGNAVAGFVGGMAGAMTDPIALMTLPIGGTGGTVLKRVGTEIIAGMTVEAALQPTIQKQREALGRPDLTAGEAVQNVVFAGAASGALRGAFEGVPRAVSATREGFESAVAKNWDRVPAPLQERWMQRATIEGQPAADVLQVDIAEAIIGRDNMSELEVDAAETVRREALFEQSNAFRSDGAGAAMHGDLADAALADILTRNPLPAIPPSGRYVAAVPDASPARARRSRDEVDSAPPVTTGRGEPGFEGVKAAIRVPESGGQDNVTNRMGSSASGRYQFIESTFLLMHRRAYGSSDAQAAAAWKNQRFDPAVQERLMDRLLADNAKVLRRAGVPIDAGNLYVAHFAGAGKAVRMAKADPSTPVSKFFSAQAIRQNPTYLGGGKTVGEALAIIRSKVGGKAAAGARQASLPRPVLSDAIGRNEAERRAIQEELNSSLARAEEADMAARAGRDGDDLADEFGDGLPEPLNLPEDDIELAVPNGEPGSPEPFNPESPAPNVDDLLPRLQEVVADRSQSLNQIEALAETLGTTALEIRRGLTRMIQRGEISAKIPRDMRKRVRNAKGKLRWQSVDEVIAERPDAVWDGAVMRTPPAPEPRGNPTLGEWISGRGGMIDPGGDARAMGLTEWHKNAPFRRRLITDEGAGADTLLVDAIEAGFFPELAVRAQGDNYADALSDQVLYDALSDELAGNPRRMDDLLQPGREEGEARPGELQDIVDRFRDELEELIPAFRDDADLEAVIEDAAIDWSQAAMEPLEALDRALAKRYAIMQRTIDEELGQRPPDEAGYEPIPENEIEAYWSAVEDAAERQRDGEGRAADAGDPERGSDVGPLDEQAGYADGQQLAQLDEGARSPFTDPDSEQVKAQAHSLEHDARMSLPEDAADPAIAQRQRDEAALRANAPLRGENATGEAQDGTMGLPMFDAADQPTFRLDEDGDDADLRGLLDDIEAEEADLKNIEDCL